MPMSLPKLTILIALLVPFFLLSGLNGYPEELPAGKGSEYVHPPFREQKCQVCHQKGSSALKRDGGALCYICHFDAAAKFKKGYIHQPVERGECTSCHRPHRSPNKHLLSQEGMDLCYSCHADARLGRSHPVGPGIIDPKIGEMMTCTSSCHYPHQSRYEYLLQMEGGRSLCLSCHEDFKNFNK